MRSTPAVSLLAPVVSGAAGPVGGVLGHHCQYGDAVVFGNTRFPRRCRRAIAQYAVLKIELPLGRRTGRGRSSVASILRDDHRCGFLSLLPHDPTSPTPGNFLDVNDLLLSSDAIKRG